MGVLVQCPICCLEEEVFSLPDLLQYVVTSGNIVQFDVGIQMHRSQSSTKQYLGEIVQ